MSEQEKNPLQAVKEQKPAHKKPVNENPKQSVKRIQAETIDKFKVFAIQQVYFNQQANATLTKQKTLIDILISKMCEGELVEVSLSKEELEKLPNEYIVEAGAAGSYAIHIDTLRIYKFVSCLELYKLDGKEEVAPKEGEQPKAIYKFSKKGLEMPPVEIEASSDQEAYGKLRAYILGL